MSYRVIVFEDNKFFREGIVELISLMKDFIVINAHPNCNAILENLREDKPDIIFMDIQMPGLNGIDAIKVVKNYNPNIKVIVQTVYYDDENIFAAICAGANGYIIKSSNLEKYNEALMDVMQSGSPMSPTIAARVLTMFKKLQEKPKNENTSNLSDRELEVLRYMAEGLSYKLIAVECNISIDTVRFHIKNIYQKLHVNSMTEAVVKAIGQKLI
jgi:DNA-binding NarL/FixJ family response regulator